MIQIANLAFKYAQGPEIKFPDFSCKKGEELLILGKSGTGKTTLLHLLGALRKPTQGQITIGEEQISKLSSGQLDRFRGKNVGIVFQTSHFVQSLSVIDNLMLVPYFSKSATDKKFAMELLESLNLASKAKKKTTDLSVGEQQRVAIARALMNKPQLLLADEPTSALDDENASQVLKLLREHASDLKSSLVIVTHDNRLKSEISNAITLH